jgi:lipopolysaccharide export system permease protein
MRASGVSIKRIAWSVFKAAVLMIVVVTAIGEGVGPLLQQHSGEFRQKTVSALHHDSLLDSVWLHQANGFTHISELKNQNTMVDITHYHFGSDGRLKRATDAQSGQWVDGQWKLLHLKKTIFLHDRVEVKTQPESDLHVAFQPNLQVQMSIDSAEQTMMDLYRTIQYRRSIGLGVNRFIFTFWQRILQPITTVVMICLAVPFVFGSFRSASMGLRVIAGVLIGFVFYMLNQLFGPLTLVYQFPPLLAALIPTCLFSLIAVILISRTR